MEMMTAKDADRITTVMIRVPTENQIRQIVDLYRTQGWWQAGDDESPHFIPRLIAGSHCFAVAVKGEDIVGMGRAISDGVSDAYIQDLTVRSDCRNQGVGRRILQVLLERLHADGLHWIGLIAEPGSDNLYRGAGFREMSPWIPMLMTSKP
jgi:aralkylamine N-acetyltransferase